MRRLYSYLLICLLVSPAMVLAQADVHYSQFYETTILRNPSLTGVFSNNFKVGVTYRNQWSSITYPYQTVQVNGEYRQPVGRSSNDFLSVGVLGYADKAGDLEQKITGLYGAINFNKSINPDHNAYLSVGFAGGYMQYSFDPSKATFNNQYVSGEFDPTASPLESLPTPKMTMYDLGAGINYNFTAGPSQSATYMIGFSGYHFTKPVFSYIRSFEFKQNVRWNANAGMVREINENVIFQVHVNYANQGTYNEIIGGALIGWRTFEAFQETEFEIYGGCLYRYGDAFIPVVKLKRKHLGFGISYDVNSSSLEKASGMRGGIEISAFVTGDYPPSKGAYRKTVCPRF